MSNADLFYRKPRKHWSGAERRTYKGRLVTAQELADLAGCSATHARKQCFYFNADPENFVKRERLKRGLAEHHDRLGDTR